MRALGLVGRREPLPPNRRPQRLEGSPAGGVWHVRVDVQVGFFQQVMKEDSQRAPWCDEFLSKLSGGAGPGRAAS
jgi:hypothetical protein